MVPALWKNMSPVLPLRAGLGIVYLYSGYELMAHPLDWSGFVPAWFADIVMRMVPLEQYLRLQGAGEIVLGIILLAWFLPRWIAGLAVGAAALEFAMILLFFGIDPVTFRDIGLLGAAMALALSLWGPVTPDRTGVSV